MTQLLEIIQNTYHYENCLVQPRQRLKKIATAHIADQPGQRCHLSGDLGGTEIILGKNDAVIINGRRIAYLSPVKRTAGCLLSPEITIKIRPVKAIKKEKTGAWPHGWNTHNPNQPYPGRRDWHG